MRWLFLLSCQHTGSSIRVMFRIKSYIFNDHCTMAQLLPWLFVRIGDEWCELPRLLVHIGGEWRELPQFHVCIGGEWREFPRLLIRISGEWREFKHEAMIADTDGFLESKVRQRGTVARTSTAEYLQAESGSYYKMNTGCVYCTVYDKS